MSAFVVQFIGLISTLKCLLMPKIVSYFWNGVRNDTSLNRNQLILIIHVENLPSVDYKLHIQSR